MENESNEMEEKPVKATRTRRAKKAAVTEEAVNEAAQIQPLPVENVESNDDVGSVTPSETVSESDAAAAEMEARYQVAKMELAQEQTEEKIVSIVQNQRAFFASGTTRDPSWRVEQLKRLYDAVKEHEADIMQALRTDLSKSEFESYSTEIGTVLSEISYQVRHIKKWSREKRVRGELFLFPAHFVKRPEPFGVTLVMSTWNYPFLLSLSPLISSLAAGNTVVLKTSEYSTATNAVIETLLAKTFNENYVSVVQGGYSENHALLNQHFDFIFFTGSQNVGKIVMNSASRFLTPVCLELGGKSPCIIDSTADIEAAAKKIVWGKFLNAGQTCVAPDYILVDESVQVALLECLEKEIKIQYTEKPLENPDYPKIINERHFVHLTTLCPEAQMDFVSNKIAPTVINLGGIKSPEIENSPLMKAEIFGPLLPVITYQHLTDVIDFVTSRPSPLALYVFSSDKETQNTLIRSIRFGGGCINDVVMHLASSKVPFGGVGESGMGSYHGEAGFNTFSHCKSILVQSQKSNVKFRTGGADKNMRLLRMFLK